jgi:hypothetical protein
VTATILLLPDAVVLAPFRTPLVPAISETVLLDACFGAATRAAIALAAITTPANPEHRMASIAAANTFSEERLPNNGHVLLQKGLDNGSQSWQGGTSI